MKRPAVQLRVAPFVAMHRVLITMAPPNPWMDETFALTCWPNTS
jgi:hypothetical protein